MGQKSFQNSILALSLAGVLLGGQVQKNNTDSAQENELLSFISNTRTKVYDRLCSLFHKNSFKNEFSSDIKEILKQFEIKGEKLNEKEINEITNGILHDLDNNGVITQIFRKTHEGEKLFFALLYSIIFLSINGKILRKIKEEHTIASNVSLGTASGINILSFVSNGPIDSMGIVYLATAITSLIMIYINKGEQRKIKEGLVVPNQINAREIGLRLYEQLMNDNSPYIIYDLHADTMDRHIQIWNPAIEKLTGYKFVEIQQKTQAEIFQLLYGHDEEELKRRIELTDITIELQKENTTYVFNIKTKDGRIIPIAWEAKRLEGGWLKIKGSIEMAEIKIALRKDHYFNCGNLLALKEDFDKKIKIHRESDKQEEVIASLIFGDIDGFGEFNKIYGHKIGDIVIEELILYLKEEFKRSGDGIYRKGGDEFIILCNKTDKYKSGEKIDNIRKLLNKTNIIVKFNKGKISVTTLTHETSEMANEYFNNEITQESNKMQLKRFGLHGKTARTTSMVDSPNFNNIIGEIVLPPISTTWGVTELLSSDLKNDSYSDNEKDTLLGELITRADICTINGKDGGKNTVIIEEEVNTHKI